MQHSAILCCIDVLSAEHSIDLFPQLGSLCQVCQQLWGHTGVSILNAHEGYRWSILA